METPEVLLSSFNKSLRRLLQASIMLENKEIEEMIKKIYKKTIISEVFFNKYIIAISGLQGAGKTTLLKEIYDIPDNVIPENLGRGEKIPILITEEKRTDYEFSTRIIFTNEDSISIIDKKLNREEFFQKAKDPSFEDIYLELKVPFKVFNNNMKSFVLLPGMEDNKEEYQSILLHSLISSATCLFLFDETRNADYRNTIAMNKIKNIFNSAKPIFILTRADQSKNQNNDLYKDFIKDFEIPENEVDRVIIKGSGAGYKNEWYPQIMNALSTYRQIEVEFREKQLETLNNLLIDDVGEVIDKLKDQLSLINIEDSVLSRQVEGYLKILNQKIDELRKQYFKKLRANLNDQGADARKKFTTRIDERDIFQIIGDFFIRDVTKMRKLLDTISEVWEESNGREKAHRPIFKTITQLQRREGLIKQDVEPSYEPGLVKFDEYDESYVEVNEDMLNDLKLLLFVKSQTPMQWKFSKKFENNLKLIPPLVLESARLVINYPNLYSVNEQDFSVQLNKNADQVSGDFKNLVNNHSNIIKGIALVMGIDAAYDGKIDSIPNLVSALTGGTTSSFTMSLATGIGAILAGIFIYKSILNQVDKSDLINQIAADRVISQLVDYHHSFYMDYFDDIMYMVYNQINVSLKERYHLTEAFTKKETLTKAIADAKKIRDDFRELIN